MVSNSSSEELVDDESLGSEESDDFVGSDEVIDDDEVVITKKIKKKKSSKKSNSSKSSSKQTPTPTSKRTSNKVQNSKARNNQKVAPKSKAEIKKIIYDYILRTNKPYTLIVLYENLHREFSKKELTNCLEDLVKSENLATKEFGKTILWWPNQTKLPCGDFTKENLESKKIELKNKENEFKEILNENSFLISENLKYEKRLEIEDLKVNIKSITENIKKDSEILFKIQNEGKFVSKKEFDDIKNEFLNLHKLVSKRIRISNEMVEILGGEMKLEKGYKKLELDFDFEKVEAMKNFVKYLESIKNQ